jgi:ribosomal protein S18 acetylase RimI-like enzyme
MTLRAEHVGQRVVVRIRLGGERGPSGGPAMTDVLGILTSIDENGLVVRREDGEEVAVRHAGVVTSKPVPPRASVRQRIAAEDLQRICAAGWVAPIQESLGEWVLRAGGGFTGRANSVLPSGDPGLPLDPALAVVCDFYAGHQLPPQVQVVVGSPLLAALEERAWTRSRPAESDALVQIASVAMARRARRGGGAEDVTIRERLSEDWVTRYGRTAGVDEAVVQGLLSSGGSVAFAQLGQPAVAIGRGVVTGDWLGLYAVEVDPSLRGNGLGSAIVDALLGWGAARGARSVYLQALAGNAAALALYARYGFSTHHAYRYLGPPA